MPATDFGGNDFLFRGSRGRSPHLGEIQFRQTFFGIVRDEFSIARGDWQFNKIGFHAIQRFNGSPSSMIFKNIEMTPSRIKNSTTTSRNEAVAGDALLVAHRAQAVDAAGGEIVHEARIRGGRAAKMVAQAVPQRGQIVFAHAEFVVMVGRIRPRRALAAALVDLPQKPVRARRAWARAAARRCANTVAPCGMAVERNFGAGARWICVSSFLISDSSAAIWSLSVRARSEIGSVFSSTTPYGKL